MEPAMARKCYKESTISRHRYIYQLTKRISNNLPNFDGILKQGKFDIFYSYDVIPESSHLTLFLVFVEHACVEMAAI